MRWLVLLVLLSGCLTQTVVREKFVCSDGWVVDSADGCAGHELECPACECPPCPDSECPPCESDVSLEYTAEAKQPATTTSLVIPPGDDCAALGCPTGSNYAASRNSDKYHLCTCEWAGRISPKNLICYETQQQAEQDNKTPCRVCLG